MTQAKSLNILKKICSMIIQHEIILASIKTRFYQNTRIFLYKNLYQNVSEDAFISTFRFMSIKKCDLLILKPKV